MSFDPARQNFHSLRPNVSRDDAIRAFRSWGPVGLLRYAASGPVRSVADVYIPFRFFRTQITNAGGTARKIFALEAVIGSLELFEFAEPPGGDQLVSISSRNILPSSLDPVCAREILLDKVRRIVFRQGFFKLREMKIEAEPLSEEIYFPYWVAFSGWGEQAHVAVMDAVRRRLEGGKAKHLVLAWLASAQDSGLAPIPFSP